MTKKMFMISAYLKYLLKAKSRHGVHSPFVYDFIEKVMHDDAEYPEYIIVEKEMKRLLHNRNTLEVVDFGATGKNKNYVIRFSRVQDIARLTSIPGKQGRLLFRMVKKFKPQNMLELGASVGVSTCYQALGNPAASFTTIEGCASVASVAQSTLDKTGCKHVKIEMAKFSSILPDVLSRLKEPLDWVFIDGDHTYSGTMDYFKQIMNHSCPGTVLILHDIHWSPDMEKAWEEIKAHPQVKVTLDLFYMGIVFFRSELSRQHFVLRF